MSGRRQCVRIAVVHDYFVQLGGAEKVAEVLYNTLPGADLFATVALSSNLPDSLQHVPVHTSWMQRLPGMRQLYRLYFPLYPFAVSSLNLNHYDLVVSSSSGYVKGVRANPEAVHVCYCHTPMRWVWSFDNYTARESFGTGIRALLHAIISNLRRWDQGASRQPDHFIANSKTVASRIQKAYGRYAEVIEPPVDLDRFRPCDEQEDYYIVLARLIAYKRIDLAVTAMSKLGRRLIVIGEGTAMAQLRSIAGPTIEFLGRASNQEVERYVARCRALIFPGEEDFGMAPLEVAAAGRPTIAYGKGGATETIIDGETGVFFAEQTADSLIEAVKRFENLEWSSQRIRKHAEQYSVDIFQSRFLSFLKRVGVQLDPLCVEILEPASVRESKTASTLYGTVATRPQEAHATQEALKNGTF